MENEYAITMKCCICGRVKTADGWQYRFRDQDDESKYSHGFCTACYEMEMRKIKLQVMPALAVQ